MNATPLDAAPLSPVDVLAPRWRGVDRSWLDVDGQQVHALHAGLDGPGLPQLLLHGLGASGNSWIEVMPELAERGPVVAPDLPGFGLSEPADGTGLTVAAAVDHVVALLDELGWDRAVLHGNSLGGLIAATIAARAPERVAGLVLSSPALPMDPRAVWPPMPATLLLLPMVLPGVGEGLLAFAAARGDQAGLAADIDDPIVGATFADPSQLTRPEITELWADDVALSGTAWRRRTLLAMTRSVVWHSVRPGGWRPFRTIDVPTVVLWGEQDRLLPAGVLRTIRRERPDWDVRVLPDVAHVPPFEAPATVVAAADDVAAMIEAGQGA